MGMFDSFIPSESMKCPSCGRRIKEFQSKDALCILACFEFGEECAYYKHQERNKEETAKDRKKWEEKYSDATKETIDSKMWMGSLISTNEVAHYLDDGAYEIHTFCDCGRRISAEAIIENKRWIGIEHIEVSEP